MVKNKILSYVCIFLFWPHGSFWTCKPLVVQEVEAWNDCFRGTALLSRPSSCIFGGRDVSNGCVPSKQRTPAMTSFLMIGGVSNGYTLLGFAKPSPDVIPNDWRRFKRLHPSWDLLNPHLTSFLMIGGVSNGYTPPGIC